MIREFFQKVKAAMTLPPIAPPKVKRGGLALPSLLKSAKPSKGSPLPATDRGLINTDITTLRTGANTQVVVRDFVAASPDLSAAVFAYIRNIVSNRYTAVAKNLDGSFNPEATAALAQVLTRFDTLTNYADGYASMTSLRSVAESLSKEVMHYGAASAELVLDKASLPARIQPLSVTHIKFYPDPGKGILRPVQEIAGLKIELDTPAFVYASLDQDLLEAYSASPLESALQPTLFGQEFLNDVRRVIWKVLHPRLHVTLDEDQLAKQLSLEAQADPAKRAEEMDAIFSTLEGIINDLEPDEALVTLKSLGIEVINQGDSNLANEYDTIKSMADAKLATGAKVPPTVLGHGVQSSNIASTETMLFMRSVLGVQGVINEIFTKLLTLAVRLLGFDVYVEFRFAEADLRPAAELETFRATKQSRILELLSLGIITDEAASIELTGALPHPGAPKLSGTMFKVASPAGGNAYGGQSNDGSTLNQNLKSDAPSGVKSQNKKADPQKAEVIRLGN